MSLRYKGARISATPATTTGGESGVASGAWTLEQQLQAQGAGNWPTPVTGPYIEDVFSTYLYTGNGSTQTITNGIDLSTKGGLVWVKGRNETYYHRLASSPGPTLPNYLASNATDAASSGNGNISAFTTTGFTVNNNSGTGGTNSSGINYASWTFRKQPKFFDVVTYTGTGSTQVIAHNLGSIPGCVITKKTSSTSNWAVYHRGITSSENGAILLNSTDAWVSSSAVWNNTAPTSTNFTVGTADATNISGQTYVAYLFAHNAGGFGLTGTDNVISCGSFTTDGSGLASVTLGYEPQYLMLKASTAAEPWNVTDTMRGWTQSGTNDIRYLQPNTSGAEGSASNNWEPNATGFSVIGGLSSSTTYIYIAIRRGPMKVPTSGTSVFSPIARSGTGATSTVSNNITTDLIISMTRNTGQSSGVWDRLRGFPSYLETTGTASESTSSDSVTAMNNTAYVLGADGGTDRINRSGYTYANWTFSRAPSFFDEVCYTGTGSATTQTHNLGVVPELVIWKRRSSTSDWRVWQSSFSVNDGLYLNSTLAKDTDPNVQTAIPTATVLNLATGAYTNASGSTYVAYLFATCAGVSKVGSYTGNGTTQTIDCGFTGGARFVLIKRTDSTGDWYVYDTARGMTVLTDPYLLLNSTAAESATLGSVTTVSTGFAVNASILAAINTNAASYIFLAIA